MNPSSLRSAAIGIPAGFASPILRRACISHRSTQLATCASPAAPRCSNNSARRYATTAGDGLAWQRDTAEPHDLAITSPELNDQKYAQLSRVLDPYLPLDYRLGTDYEVLTAFEGVRNPRTLAKALNEINGNFPQGALTYIALTQYRWSAYLYLAEALIGSENVDETTSSALFEGSPWNSVDTTFPNIGLHDGHVVFDPHAKKQASSATVIKQTGQGSRSTDGWRTNSIDDSLQNIPDLIPQQQKAMGYLWQSLGHVILKSTAYQADYAAYMMSHVHRILGCLHHEGKIHRSMYEFDSQETREVSRKPPFLHIMASRLISTMSDAVWKAQESKVIKFYDLMVATDQKTTGPKLWDTTPLVLPIGPEAWLELVLWSCVHERHVEAAAALIDDMTISGQESWNSIAWPSLLASALESTSKNDSNKFKARFNRVAREGYSTEPPIVALPPRTISREVLVAVLDLMISFSHQEEGLDMLDRVQKLKMMLPVEDSYASRTFLNAMLLRLLDSADFPPDTRPMYVDSIATLLLRDEPGSHDSPNSLSEKEDQRLVTGVPIEVLHHRAVAAFLSLGDLRGALGSVNRLKDWLNGRKWQTMTNFLSLAQPQKPVDLKSESAPQTIMAQGSVSLRKTRFADSDLIDNRPEQYGLKMPPRTLGTLLEQVVRQGMLELGKWMVFSTDPDDVPLISGKDFNSHVVQPSLILLGVAIGDARLVRKVVKRIRHSSGLVDESILQASLQAQTVLRKFVHAETILSLMREQSIEVSNTCVFELARVILQLEYMEPTHSTQRDLSDACRLLSNILRAYYSPTPLAHTRPNYALFQRLNQLSSIISSVGGHLGAAAGRTIFRPTSGQLMVAASDFEMLLEAVAEAQGPTMAKSLYDRWCRRVQPETAIDNSMLPLTGWGEPDEEACVIPSPRTVQMIIKPILRHLRDEGGYVHDLQTTGSEAFEEASRSGGKESDTELIIKPGVRLKPLDRPLLEWAMQKMLSLGMYADEVVSEMPEAYELGMNADEVFNEMPEAWKDY